MNIASFKASNHQNRSFLGFIVLLAMQNKRLHEKFPESSTGRKIMTCNVVLHGQTAFFPCIGWGKKGLVQLQ